MATIFSRIVKGEIPCYKIAEDERFFAFMDINPVQKGHTLVIPKREDDYIFNLTDDEIGAMMPITQEGDMDFKKEHVKMSEEEFKEVQKRIVENL